MLMVGFAPFPLFALLSQLRDPRLPSLQQLKGTATGGAAEKK
jgi:hypothetical protein